MIMAGCRTGSFKKIRGQGGWPQRNICYSPRVSTPNQYLLVLVDDGMRSWRALISHIFAKSRGDLAGGHSCCGRRGGWAL